MTLENGSIINKRARQNRPLRNRPRCLFCGGVSVGWSVDKGLEQAQASLKLDDRSWWGLYWMGVADVEKGMSDRAIETPQTAVKIDNSPLIPGVLAYALGRAGRKAEAQKEIDQLLEESKPKYIPPSMLFIAHSGLGDRSGIHVGLRNHIKLTMRQSRSSDITRCLMPCATTCATRKC